MAKRNSKSGTGIGKMLIFLIIIAACVGAWQLYASSAKKKADAQAVGTENLTKVITPKGTPEQIVSYPGMTVSFNSAKHVPNWVAWELTASMAEGKVPRESGFYNDPDVAGCAETYDYSYSGYDRGHMAPAGDMKWSSDAMHATFSLANICPQAHSLNSGSWKKLEEKCRTWAKADSSIIIVCGPVLTDNIREYIGDTRVAVPQRFFKVILAPHANPVRGIGFIMPNDKVPGGMQAAAVSIDDVEKATGLDFFSSLPDEIENEVEKQCDFHRWSTIRPKNSRK
ncbi:MAG: DNA/RNA non-specific endonuclease [Paramuribaculum sp.]